MLLIYLGLIFMIIMWSFSFVIVDIAVEFISPLSFALYRFVIASFAFLIIDLCIKIRKNNETTINKNNTESLKFFRNDWILLILASFTGISFFFLAQYSAIQIIGPSLPALFVCLLAPVGITILALIFFNEKLTILKVIGFLVATIGGFLLITGGNLANLTPQSPNFIGYLFALITPFLWAIYSIATKKIIQKKSNIKTLKYIAYLGTVELFVFVLLNNEFSLFITNFLNGFVLLSALYTGIGCYILGYYIWQNSQLKLKSSKAASFLYVEPFITLLFSFLLKRSETILIWNIVGGIIVLIGVLIINYK
ncbi:MAG: DMT family transporter [Candidatus Hodarchaeales archaeon]